MQSKILSLPKIEDPRGNLSVIEGITIPFKINRVYYLYDVPSGAERGGHAHKNQQEFIVAVAGSFEVVLNNGTEEKVFRLFKPNEGLYVPVNTWRELRNFSAGAVCLVVSSHEFDEEDYIRDYTEYKQYIVNS
ncbi:MAG TPA: FdtA/QdtA family cupin domain-containing protein [Flavobacterium sp.]|nr:FdtA/QdtA family cupin domain-containing protein [Flavobacterium sp.]